MALKLRRQAEVFTNGIPPHQIAVRPRDAFKTGAASFKRMLGGTPLDGGLPPRNVCLNSVAISRFQGIRQLVS